MEISDLFTTYNSIDQFVPKEEITQPEYSPPVITTEPSLLRERASNISIKPEVNTVKVNEPYFDGNGEVGQTITKNYSNIKGFSKFSKAYDNVEKRNPDAKRYRSLLTELANIESGFNSAIQNNAGAPAYGYFQFMQDGKKYNNISKFANTDINSFRNNPELQIEAAIKLAQSFEKGLSSEDIELAKQKGATTNGLIAGAWLGGNKGVRNYLKGLGNPSDKHWSSKGHGTTVGERIRSFSKLQSGGTISNNSYKPDIPISIERTVNNKKWSDLTPVERFNNRKGRVDGKPQEQGLIPDHTDFDILMLGRSILNAPKAIDALSREFNSNIKNSSQKTIANKLSVNQIDREVTNKGILSFKPTNTSLPEYMNNKQVYNNGDVATYLNKNSNKYVSVNGKKVKASTVELQEQTNGNVLLNGNLNIGKYEHINPKDSYIHIDDQIVGKSNINKPNIDSEGNLVGGKSSFKTNYVWWEKNSPYYKDRKANIRTLVTDSPGKVFDARDVTRFGSPNSVLSTKTDINNIIGYEHNPLTNYHSRVIYQQPNK